MSTEDISVLQYWLPRYITKYGFIYIHETRFWNLLHIHKSNHHLRSLKTGLTIFTGFTRLALWVCQTMGKILRENMITIASNKNFQK